ncbi:MAG: alpha/beta hydrolase [Pseudomonadota bacterium]
MNSNTAPTYLNRQDQPALAYHHHKGDENAPHLLFCGGFKSDMQGAKALALEDHCRTRGLGFTRFDYRGHGQSEGAFEDGSISDWLEDTLAIIDEATEAPLILVGSSMGGWIVLLAAHARPDKVAGLIGIAAAPDFTERLMWRDMDEETRQILMETGRIETPSEYEDSPYIVTRKLIEDGRKHLLLDAPIEIDVPVRLLHGQRDTDVPFEFAQIISDQLISEDITIELVKAGDHRLSEPQDLLRLTRTVDELVATIRS